MFSILFHLIAFLKDGMGMELLYIFLMVVFLVIDDDDDNGDNDNNANNLFLFYVLGLRFQKKKSLKIYR